MDRQSYGTNLPQNRPGCLDSPRHAGRRWNHIESKHRATEWLDCMTDDMACRQYSFRGPE